jgi:hypothetical protein
MRILDVIEQKKLHKGAEIAPAKTFAFPDVQPVPNRYVW